MHASDLRIKVRNLDGTIRPKAVIRSNDFFIDSQPEIGFSIRISVEA